MSILEMGGNAFDAAVAAGFVLQVVEPLNNGPAGDVAIVVHESSSSTAQTICGQGPMPAKAMRAHFRDLGLTHVPGSGLLSATVPGAFGAWLRLLQEYGTLQLSEVLSPAISYADDGYPIMQGTVDAITELAPLFATEWLGSANLYLPNGVPPTAGARFRNTTLAATYQRILDEATSKSGRDSQIEFAVRTFYQGFVAEEIERFILETSALDATGRRHKGLLSGEDLAAWYPEVSEACSIQYRGLDVYKPGPWSQGPVFLQQLGMLKGFDLVSLGLGTAEYVHTIVECAKLAFADREGWYGDPEHSSIPIKTLLSPDYSTARRQLITDQASGVRQPGVVDGRTTWIPVPAIDSHDHDVEPWIAHLGSGLPNVIKATAARTDTCCITVTDSAGNTVAATPSGGWLKSSPTIPALGFSLGTRGQTMWLVDGHPNSLHPGRRPRTTLSPTVVLKDGKPFVSFGTPGGDQQDQWTLLFFLAMVEFGLDSQAAAESLAFHSNAVPSSFTPRECHPLRITIEDDCDSRTIEDLRVRGHEVALAPALSLGKICATGFDAKNGFVFASASPRRQQAYAICR
ncbi:gamma-glutamyltransferase [Nocardia rhamnosiphila]|uniref:gamma-glutamyltransferase family protein n=1 Tax=Nocardia rhamnosiphila TaxID=426716 RepID=UPI0033C9649F